MIGVGLWKSTESSGPQESVPLATLVCNSVSLAAECECRVTLTLTNSEKTFEVERIGAGCSECFQIRCVSAKGREPLGEDGIVQSFASEVGDVLHERHD